MSNIEQSLSLLLPSLADHLPPELVALSNSLLAQSRNKASNLKAEEEIARPYACCEIACKRLGAKLKLPTLHSRPPCAPRVYKKLLNFLEQAIPAKLATKSAQDDSRILNDVSLSRRTPRKTVPRSSQSTPQTTLKKRGTGFAGKIIEPRASIHEHNDDGAPSWVMPLIRHLCQTLSTPLLVPHVYTGLCVVLPLADLEPSQDDEDETYQSEVTGLTLALFFLVLSRMQRGKMSGESYVMDCEKACKITNEEENNKTATTTTTQLSKEHIDTWIKRISASNWTTDQDWWSSVPENIFDRVENMTAEEGRESEPNVDVDNIVRSRKRRQRDTGDIERDPEGVLLPGLGTMMQESIDWLSEGRRAEYLDWRAMIEKRLELMEEGKEKGKLRVKGKGKAKAKAGATTG